jgi:hypothetical protein
MANGTGRPWQALVKAAAGNSPIVHAATTEAVAFEPATVQT